MSLPIETIVSLLEAHPYLLLFPLVVLEWRLAILGRTPSQPAAGTKPRVSARETLGGGR